MEEKDYSTLMIERIAAGELAMPDEASETLRERVAAVRASNDEILAAYPPEAFARDINRRLEAVEDEESDRVLPFKRPNVRGYALLAAAVIIALAGVLPRLIDRSGADATGPIRIKGLEPSILVYRQVDDGAERLGNRAAVSEGDLLQVAYIAAQKPYGAILSLDGRGVVTVHYPDPFASSNAARLESDGEVALDSSYRLDDAPQYERFFFLTSDRVFSIGAAVDAIERIARSSNGLNGTLELPDYIDQYSVALMKESSR